MNKKLIVGLGALALVLLMVGAGILYDRLAPDAAPDRLATVPPGEPTATAGPSQEASQAPEEPLAPDFTVYDREGNEAHLSDYLGTPVVLNFWASWCGPCQSEMPDFEEAWQELEGELQFMMINMTDGDRESVESASAFIEEQGYTFPVFYDTDMDAAMAYGASSLPTTYFIDQEGHATAYAVGALDADTLRQGIDMITPKDEDGESAP